MKTVKLALVSVFSLFCLLSFCEEAVKPSVDNTNTAKKDFSIVASFYPIYIEAMNIAAGIPGVTVKNMIKSSAGCLHDYQFTPEDMKNLLNSDAFIINGAGMESFVDQAIKERSDLKIINASEEISLIKENKKDPEKNASIFGWFGGSSKEVNGHVWLSVTNAVKQVNNIAIGLAKADPAHKDAYYKNADAYIVKLEALKTKIHDDLKKLKNRKIITFHEAFPYFAREFDLETVAVIEIEPGSEPSSDEMAATIRKIWKSGAKAIFVEPQYPAKSADAIARETDSKVYILDPVVSGPDDPDAYIKIMEKNLEVLKKALK